jgi:hypothetical protein
MITSDARYTCEIQSRIAKVNAAFNRKETLFTSALGYIWSRAFYGAETWTLQKVDQKYLESFEVCYW